MGNRSSRRRWDSLVVVRPASSNERTKPQPAAAPKYRSYQDEIEQRPIEELDSDEQEVRKAYDTFERQDEERSDSYNQKTKAIQRDEEKLHKARKYIETSRLDMALPYVQEETKHWPRWSKMPEDRNWDAPLPITDVDGTKGYGKQSWVQFRSGGSLFRIDFDESSSAYNDEYQFGNMRLSVDGVEVLGMGVLREWAKEFDRWRFVSVESLKVGPWMSEFVEFYGKLRAVNEAQMEDVSNEYVVERAARIDLGQGDSDQ